ncbi:MAG: hypothetical protein Q7U82_08990 [Gammaproteobacteria bacterium]|nr:hypothetical protein [Gammaproteobacteria bacterium]
MSRNAQYRVQDLPQNFTLNLVEPVFGRLDVSLPTAKTPNGVAASSTSPTASSFHEIETNLNEIRMQFIATLGEAETYKSILAEHPCLREKLESTYHKSRDKSSNLMGQLRALEQTVKILAEHQ